MSRPEFWDGSCYFCGPRVRDGSGMAPALVIERSRNHQCRGHKSGQPDPLRGLAGWPGHAQIKNKQH